MSPTVGRIVHYVALGSRRGVEPEGECLAAIVTKVAEGGAYVSLTVFDPMGMTMREGVVEDGSPTPATGTWHWPERSDLPDTLRTRGRSGELGHGSDQSDRADAVPT